MILPSLETVNLAFSSSSNSVSGSLRLGRLFTAKLGFFAVLFDMIQISTIRIRSEKNEESINLKLLDFLLHSE